jgi:hypothetical protein
VGCVGGLHQPERDHDGPLAPVLRRRAHLRQRAAREPRARVAARALHAGRPIGRGVALLDIARSVGSRGARVALATGDGWKSILNMRFTRHPGRPKK